MLGAILICIFGVLIVCAALRYQLRSTPTHLVATRRHRITPTRDELAATLAKHTAAEHADWPKVRELEWDIYGRYLTGLDGRPLDDDDPAATARNEPKPETDLRCWCNYCKGRVGVHGPDAVALYKAQVQAALDQHRRVRTPRQVITNVTAGGNVTQVVSAGRNVVITGDAAGVIVTGDNTTVVQSYEDLTPQDISNMSMQDWSELRRHMDRLGYDLSEAIQRATRGMFG